MKIKMKFLPSLFLSFLAFFIFTLSVSAYNEQVRCYGVKFIWPISSSDYDASYYYKIPSEGDSLVHVYPEDVTDIVRQALASGNPVIVSGECRESSGEKWYKSWCNGRDCYIHSDNLYRDAEVPQVISVSNVVAPTETLKPGWSFGLKGIISSSLPITKVSAYIYADGNRVVSDYQAHPYQYSYNIAYDGMDSAIRFGGLECGDYRYVVEAVTEQYGPQVIIKTYFHVSPISIAGEISPRGTIKQGNSFGLYGVISSNNPLGSIYAAIYNSSGEIVMDYETYTSSNQYNINYSGINNNFLFGKLAPGMYRYVVNVYGTNGDWPALFGSEFRVA